ncbi:hypothetical protein L9F63_013970, partial [Diploptera punctata]
ICRNNITWYFFLRYGSSILQTEYSWVLRSNLSFRYHLVSHQSTLATRETIDSILTSNHLIISVFLSLLTTSTKFNFNELSSIRYQLQQVCLQPLVRSVVIRSRNKGGWVNLILLAFSILGYGNNRNFPIRKLRSYDINIKIGLVNRFLCGYKKLIMALWSMATKFV